MAVLPLAVALANWQQRFAARRNWWNPWDAASRLRKAASRDQQPQNKDKNPHWVDLMIERDRLPSIEVWEACPLVPSAPEYRPIRAARMSHSPRASTAPGRGCSTKPTHHSLTFTRHRSSGPSPINLDAAGMALDIEPATPGAFVAAVGPLLAH